MGGEAALPSFTTRRVTSATSRGAIRPSREASSTRMSRSVSRAVPAGRAGMRRRMLGMRSKPFFSRASSTSTISAALCAESAVSRMGKSIEAPARSVGTEATGATRTPLLGDSTRSRGRRSLARPGPSLVIVRVSVPASPGLRAPSLVSSRQRVVARRVAGATAPCRSAPARRIPIAASPAAASLARTRMAESRTIQPLTRFSSIDRRMMLRPYARKARRCDASRV